MNKSIYFGTKFFTWLLMETLYLKFQSTLQGTAMTNSIRNSGPSNSYLPPSDSHAGPSGSGSRAATLTPDVLLKMQKQAAKDGLESLQKYKNPFTATGEPESLSHKERIERAAQSIDDSRNFSQLEACWQNNNKGSIRKIVVDLMGAARLTGIGAITVRDLEPGEFKRMNELSDKPDHLLSKSQRKELIKLSAHALLKEKIFGVELNELSGQAGTKKLKEMYDHGHVHATDTSLTARMGTIFTKLDEINQHKTVLDDIKREPIRSTLTAIRSRLPGAPASSPAAPRTPTPLTSSATTGRNLKSKIRAAVVGKEDYGYNGFGKKAVSTHGIGKPDPIPGAQEIAGSRNGGKMLRQAFKQGGLRGGISEVARQAGRQWAKGGSPDGEHASHGYVDRPETSNLNQRLNALVREQAERAGRPPVPEKDLPPTPASSNHSRRTSSSSDISDTLKAEIRIANMFVETTTPEAGVASTSTPLPRPESKALVEGGESSSTQPPPVPPKDWPMPSAATGPAARVASSGVQKAPALEVDHTTAVAMMQALNYLETTPSEPVPVKNVKTAVRTPDVHDMYDPANKEKLALAAEVAGPKATTAQVEAAYKELVAEKPMDELLRSSHALLEKLSK